MYYYGNSSEDIERYIEGKMYYGTYRTKTYIAGDWTGDKNAIDQLRKWNDSNYWSLSFVDAHDITQAKDSSLNCSIKASLKKRLDVSKTFVFVVGKDTKNLRSGSCSYCQSYNSYWCGCARGHSVDLKSYIEYECQQAVNAKMKIVVLYNSTVVNKEKCPDSLKTLGTHVAMQYYREGHTYWDYIAVKNAIMN